MAVVLSVLLLLKARTNFQLIFSYQVTEYFYLTFSSRNGQRISIHSLNRIKKHVYLYLQSQLETENLFYRQALDEERDRCERLEDQINDLTELHQHEVTNIKQVI